MDWVNLAIPLIAVAVWILSNLASQNKNARRAPGAPVPPPRSRNPFDPLTARSQTKPDENNKYRDELDRKREKKLPPPKVIPRPRPRRGDLVNKKAPPVVLAVPPALPQVIEPIVPLTRLGGVAAPLAKSVPPALKTMLDLLKNRESLTTAFLLKEVLDLPVSKRPHRRL